MKSFNVVLIGAGNLATQLGKALRRAGHDVPQVYSRTMENAAALARQLGATATDCLESVMTDADLYVISVTDRVLEEVSSSLSQLIPGSFVVHTAGSMPMDVLKGKFRSFGVFYPMQTFSKTRDVSFSHIPVFVEGSTPEVAECLCQLADTLTDTCCVLPTEERRYLHLAAVWACNFTNHCYHVAEKVLTSHGIPFRVMLPLIDETARKVHELPPAEAQTGPAVRYDKNVIDRLSALMNEQPELQTLFDQLSKGIWRFRNVQI